MIRKPKDLPAEKIAIIIILNSILISLGTDIHLPSLPLMKNDLHATEFQSQLVLMIFMVGAVVSRLVWGPVSDLYGRRKVLLFTLLLQVIAQTGLAISNNIYHLIFWRAFQSLGAGVITVIGTVIVADSFRGDNRAKYLGLLEMAFPVAFVIAPIFGAILLDFTNSWRAPFIFMWFIIVICFLMSYFLIPETNTNLASETKIIHSFKMYLRVIKNFQFMIYSTIIGLTISVYMMFAICSPFIYIEDMSVSLNEYALLMCIPLIINIISTFIYKYVVLLYGIDRCIKAGMIALTTLIPAFFVIGYGLIEVTPNVVLSAMCLHMAIVPFFISGFIAKTMDLYPYIKGLCSSASASVRALVASILMIFGTGFIGNEVGPIFMAMGFIIMLVLLLHLFSINTKNKEGLARLRP